MLILISTMISIFYKDINNNNKIVEDWFEICDPNFILPEPPDYNSDDDNDIKTAKYKAFFDKCFIDYNTNNRETKDNCPKHVNLLMYKRILRKYKNIIRIKKMIYTIV